MNMPSTDLGEIDKLTAVLQAPAKQDQSRFQVVFEVRQLQAGSVVHSFKNVGEETAKLLLVVTPAGLENYFAEAFLPATDIADVPAAEVIARLLKAAPKYGLEYLLPAGMRP